jgi:xanthine dehydrogenase YagR molybdenum-binding subunit
MTATIETTIGTPIDRIDGKLKVTGAAAYTSDQRLPNMAFAVPVCSTIATGELIGLELDAARAMPGVLDILHHGNIGVLHEIPAGGSPGGGDIPMIDERRLPFADLTIRYFGQYIAVVIAETFEAATEAAARVDATYSVTDPAAAADEPEKAEIASERGNVEHAFATATVRIDALYETPPETHNPIELHATVAVWDRDGAGVTLYETSQAVSNQRAALAHMLGLAIGKVRVITHYLGSGFGGKLWPWPHSVLAAVAARQLDRPVKLVVTRDMMFQNVGHRPYTHQRVRIAATRAGELVALDHDFFSATSLLDVYEETCGEATMSFYSTPNLRVRGGVRRRPIGTPTAMRGPGAVPGLFATESALDELAEALAIDPVRLRLDNEPAQDESKNIPFSSRHYAECLTLGGQKFGWSQRTPAVGSMRAGDEIVGYGVAGAQWIAERFDCEVAIELHADGTVHVHCGTQDIGTGTYTMLAQITAHAAGVSPDRVRVMLGDTDLPPGPVSGGSMVTASIIPAIMSAMKAAQRELGPDHAHRPFAELLRAADKASVRGRGKSAGTFSETTPAVSRHSFGAHFIEVRWQPEIARLRVARVVTVMDAGRIVNPKAARNQIAGSIVMGIGMAMFEETHYDPASFVPLNRNLADYIMPTNADTPPLDITFLDYPDMHINELGARGVGEIGLAGVAPAIASAVYHATGKRIRALPVTIEKLLATA